MGKRGRKSSYINTLTTKDRRMLTAFRNVGYIKQSDLKEELEQSDNRIRNFCRNDYLEKCSYLNVHTHETFHVYRLTPAGKKYCEKQLGMTNFYRSSSAEHDLSVSEHYFELSAKEQDSWLTETDLRQELLRRNPDRFEELQTEIQNHEISSLDGGYINDESCEFVGVEVITRGYDSADIEAKVKFARELNIEFERIKG